MIQIKTVTTTATETEIAFEKFNLHGAKDLIYIWVRNLGDNDVYIGDKTGVEAEADDTILIKAGDIGLVTTALDNKIYAVGASKLECHAQLFAECPFRGISSSGGGGGRFTPEQMAVINSHTIAFSYPNLVDKNAEGATKDGYYNQFGVWRSAAGFYQSDYIPVQPSKYYTSLPQNVFVLWYAEDKSYVSQSSSTTFAQNGYVVAPSRAKYAKFITTSDYYDTWQVEESMFVTPYVPYGTAREYQNTGYSEKNGVAFGTSLTYRAETTGGYLQNLQALSGINWHNYGIGSALIYTNNTNYSILNKIKSCSAEYLMTRDVCIIEGFVNDWYYNSVIGNFDDDTETSACGCLRSAFNYILTSNPKITVFLVLDHYGKGITAETEINSGGLTQYEYYEILAKVANSMGVPVIKLYEDSGINQYTANTYLIDNIHPNALGAKQTANVIWDNMKQHSIKVT